MEQASGSLTILFDPPFWVGIFERIDYGKLTVSKVTFGADQRIMMCTTSSFITTMS